MDSFISRNTCPTDPPEASSSCQSYSSIAPLEVNPSVSSFEGIANPPCTLHAAPIGSVCIDIEAIAGALSHPSRFKTAIGPLGPKPTVSQPESRLRTLMSAFFQSYVGRQQPQPQTYQAFEDILKAKYNLAMTLHCLTCPETKASHTVRLQSQWLSISEMDRCLTYHPGVVHVWVDSPDMQVLFVPSGSSCVACAVNTNRTYLEHALSAAPQYDATTRWAFPPAHSNMDTEANFSMPEFHFDAYPGHGTNQLTDPCMSSASDWTTLLRNQNGFVKLTSVHVENPTAQNSVFQLNVTYDILTKGQAFRAATGLTCNEGFPKGSEMRQVFDEFFESQRGKNLKKSRLRFADISLAKCRLAVNAVYATAGKGWSAEEIRWGPGQIEADFFQRWLQINLGSIHMWADEEDLYAVFRPDAW
jgi:hypothetical protein